MTKAKNLLIHTHLGLGDHFICCGLVRKIILKNEYEKYFIVCKKKNYNSVKYLFNDLKNTYAIEVENDKQVQQLLNADFDYFKSAYREIPGKKFDYSFYNIPGYSIEDKLNYFKINRNTDKERDLINALGINGDYIFVHDISSSGIFDLNIPSTNYKIVKPDPNLNFPAVYWLGVIEKAKQIHVIDSSFVSLIDLALKREELYFHNIKTAAFGHEVSPTLFQNWNIIKYQDVYRHNFFTYKNRL